MFKQVLEKAELKKVLNGVLKGVLWEGLEEEPKKVVLREGKEIRDEADVRKIKF